MTLFCFSQTPKPPLFSTGIQTFTIFDACPWQSLTARLSSHSSLDNRPGCVRKLKKNQLRGTKLPLPSHKGPIKVCTLLLKFLPIMAENSTRIRPKANRLHHIYDYTKLAAPSSNKKTEIIGRYAFLTKPCKSPRPARIYPATRSPYQAVHPIPSIHSPSNYSPLTNSKPDYNYP